MEIDAWLKVLGAITAEAALVLVGYIAWQLRLFRKAICAAMHDPPPPPPPPALGAPVEQLWTAPATPIADDAQEAFTGEPTGRISAAKLALWSAVARR